jgi:hypothetical protein
MVSEMAHPFVQIPRPNAQIPQPKILKAINPFPLAKFLTMDERKPVLLVRIRFYYNILTL